MVTPTNLTLHSCDLCGSSDFTPIEVARQYMGGQEPPVVCMTCGFVYVRERRSSAEIARAWDEIYESGAYSSEWPAVKARLFYVAEWFEQEFKWDERHVLDIGAGTGTFLNFVREYQPYKQVCCDGLDPAGDTGRLYKGAIEDFKPEPNYDVVTIVWTLENCGDCLEMLRRARDWLVPDGILVVATGSRLLVPYKKPISAYFSANPADTHAFRWSRNSMAHACGLVGMKAVKWNRYNECDWLVGAFQRMALRRTLDMPDGIGRTLYDNPREVLEFFRAWARWEREWRL